MKLVRENINFERGGDPKISIGIGLVDKIKRSIENIFIEDYKNLYIKSGIGGNVLSIGTSDKVFQIHFYSNNLVNPQTGLHVNRKNYAIELVTKAGIAELFDDVDYDYKVRWHIKFKIKEEYREAFKKIKGWYDSWDYNK